jgi:hypothetical protein
MTMLDIEDCGGTCDYLLLYNYTTSSPSSPNISKFYGSMAVPIVVSFDSDNATIIWYSDGGLVSGDFCCAF